MAMPSRSSFSALPGPTPGRSVTGALMDCSPSGVAISPVKYKHRVDLHSGAARQGRDLDGGTRGIGLV